MALPELPSGLIIALRLADLNQVADALIEWVADLRKIINTQFHTIGDSTHVTVGKGPVVPTPDGTKKYRLGVDNAGNPTQTLVP